MPVAIAEPCYLIGPLEFAARKKILSTQQHHQLEILRDSVAVPAQSKVSLLSWTPNLVSWLGMPGMPASHSSAHVVLQAGLSMSPDRWGTQLNLNLRTTRSVIWATDSRINDSLDSRSRTTSSRALETEMPVRDVERPIMAIIDIPNGFSPCQHTPAPLLSCRMFSQNHKCRESCQEVTAYASCVVRY